MKEEINDKPQKYSLVTGEKIKKKRLGKLKKEHEKQAKEDKALIKKETKRKKRIDRKLNGKENITVESKTITKIDGGLNKNVINEQVAGEIGAVKNEEKRTEVLVVRRAEKGRPATRKRKLMNFLSYALVGFVAIFFGYISGNFYIVNVLNKVDYGAFSEELLREDNKLVYDNILASNKSFVNIPAGELFMAGEYVLSIQDSYYASTLGAIQPSIGSKQDIWGYKKKTGNIYECESASKGMLSLAEKYSYDVETKQAKIYKASKISLSGCSYPEKPTWEMGIDAYKKEYGTNPDAPAVPYIVSSKTVIAGTESVKDLGGGRYQLSFNLTTDSSVINYIKQVKHMSGLQGYPTFKIINVTAVIDSSLKFISIRYDESYSVVYFGVMATCSGFVESEFSY